MQEDFRSSEKGVAAAKLGFDTLKRSLVHSVSEVAASSLPDLKTQEVGEFLLLSGVGPWMTVLWSFHFVNTLSESHLRVEILSGPPKIPGFVVWSDPRRIKAEAFDYVLFAAGQSGYRERANTKREFSPSGLAEHLLNLYLDLAGKFKPDM